MPVRWELGQSLPQGQAELAVSRDQHPAPTFHVSAWAEGSQGSAVHSKKLLTAFLQHWWVYPSPWCSVAVCFQSGGFFLAFWA